MRSKLSGTTPPGTEVDTNLFCSLCPGRTLAWETGDLVPPPSSALPQCDSSGSSALTSVPSPVPPADNGHRIK